MATISLSHTRLRGTFISWSAQPEGAKFVGRFVELRDAKFGPVADVETATGLLTLPTPTVLLKQLSQVAPGAGVTIIHHGLKKSRVGDRTYRSFEVLIDEEDLVPERQKPEPEKPSEAEAVGADDVPF